MLGLPPIMLCWLIMLRNMLYIRISSQEVVYKEVQHNRAQRKVCECPACVRLVQCMAFREHLPLRGYILEYVTALRIDLRP